MRAAPHASASLDAPNNPLATQAAEHGDQVALAAVAAAAVLGGLAYAFLANADDPEEGAAEAVAPPQVELLAEEGAQELVGFRLDGVDVEGLAADQVAEQRQQSPTPVLEKLAATSSSGSGKAEPQGSDLSR